MSYIFFAFLAAFLFASTTLASKFISKHKIDNPDSLFALAILSFTPYILTIPIFAKLSITQPAFLLLVFYSILYILGVYLLLHAIFVVDASTVSPLFQLQAGFIVILAAIFLGERFPLSRYLVIAALIIGALLVSVDERMNIKSFFQRGVLLILGMQLLHATSNIFVGLALRSINFWSVMFFGYILHTILVLLFILIKRPKLNYPPKTIGLVFIRSAFQFYGALFLFRAFQENLSVSSSIGLLAAPMVLVISVFSSRFFPQLLEHHTTKVYVVRGVGLLIMLIGAIKLALGG